MRNDGWRKVIDQSKDDWYIEHQRNYGSLQWNGLIVFMFSVSATVAVAFYHYIYLFNDNLTTEQWKLSYFCAFWYQGHTQLVPLFILCSILRHISILDDSIGLRKEIKVIAIMVTIVMSVQLINSVFLAIADFYKIDIQDQYWWIINIVRLLFNHISWCIIIYRSTGWVLKKFERTTRHRSSDSALDPSAITLSTTEIRRIGHETTLQSVEESKESQEVDDHEEALEMKRILKINGKVFDAFMLYIQLVCCHSNIYI